MCAHFYCGNSSDNLFWIPHSPKYKPSMQNPEWEIFCVNRTSGPCDMRYNFSVKIQIILGGLTF